MVVPSVGTLQGIDVEIASAIADQAGRDVKASRYQVNGPVDGSQAGCEMTSHGCQKW